MGNFNKIRLLSGISERAGIDPERMGLFWDSFNGDVIQ